MTALLAGASAVVALAALIEVAAGNGPWLSAWARETARRLLGERARSSARLARELGLAARLTRAGIHDPQAAGRVLWLKGGLAAAGAGAALMSVAGLPARAALAIAIGLPVLGFLLPDLMLERRARERSARVRASMPDALDTLAVAVGGGRGHVAALGDLARSQEGELAGELRVLVADIECGVDVSVALELLRRRVGGRQMAALVSALERSRRFGTPLADQLAGQASALRAEQRRELAERAARAAPKIQLVVALVLVPASLLLIAAALLAHSASLFPVV